MPSIPLRETLPAPTTVHTQPPDSPVAAVIEGTFARCNGLSLNHRYYPTETVHGAIDRAKIRLADAQAPPIQMLEQHAAADDDRTTSVLGRVREVWLDGDTAWYRAEIPNTTAGRDLAVLLAGGFARGVSLRADPTTARVRPALHEGQSVQIVDAFDLEGLDFTLRPGFGEHARVRSVVFESVDPMSISTTAPRESEDDPRYSTKERDDMPKDDFGEPDEDPPGFPIRTQKDIEDAARRLHQAKDPEAVKRRIIAIAKRKGLELPDSWVKEDADVDKEPETDDKTRESVTLTADQFEALLARVGGVRESAEPEKEHRGSKRLRDHLKAAHDHVAHALGLGCTGDGMSHLDEAHTPVSSLDRERLARAHDHISTVLGMECVPGGVGDADGDEDEPEAMGTRMRAQDADVPIPLEAVRRIVKETLRESTGTRAPAASPDLVGVLRALAESQTSMHQQLAAVTASVPTIAAEVAEATSWRPERKTQIQENADAAPGMSAAGLLTTLEKQARDRSVPIERRIHNYLSVPLEQQIAAGIAEMEAAL